MEDLVFVADGPSAKALRPLADSLETVQGEIEDLEEAIQTQPTTNIITAANDESSIAGNAVSDDETETEHSENDDDASSVEESSIMGGTVMDSLASLGTALTKENTSRTSSSTKTKTTSKARRSSAQSGV
ncbi:MAG: hypothetical protein SGARI_007392, partial [Bacillariaceae sp.]